MKQIHTTDGSIIFSLPDSASELQEISPQTPKTRRSRSAGSTTQANPELLDIIEALTEDELLEGRDKAQVAQGFSVDLGEGKAVSRRRGAGPQGAESMSIDVQLEPGQEAVVLIEQDGSYEWRFPKNVKIQQQRRRRGGAPQVDEKQAHFVIPIGEGKPPSRRSRGTRAFSGAFTNFIKGKIVGFVLKFVARKAVGAISRRLEKGVAPGPVIITSATDAEAWRHEANYGNVELPKDRAARILLLIHGTFSSTKGSFGALVEYREGRDFLQLALEHYDAVLAYDHYTLADTPAQNAEEIFQQLTELQKRSRGIEIDTISFSRGGLVCRYLTEQIVPLEKSQLAFRKAIFVACTNAGTELAKHQNWKDLVDLYTNLVAGASRLLSLHPATKIAGMVLREGVQSIGSLVKYMAQDAVADNAVPGLAAMEPAGDFVQALNKAPFNRKRSAAHSYYAIGSNFAPDSESSAGKLGKRFLEKIADGLVDRLMGKNNDLVVHTESMFVVDPLPNASLKEKLHFKFNGNIYHTVYFHQPEVARKFVSWLELAPLQRGMLQDAPRDWWPSEVTEDFTVLPGNLKVDAARDRLADDDSRFIVIERNRGGKTFHYGIPRDAFDGEIAVMGQSDRRLAESLDLHEYDATGVTMSEVLNTGSLREFHNITRMPSRGRAVIVDNGRAVGVAAEPQILSVEDLEVMPPPAPEVISRGVRGGRGTPGRIPAPIPSPAPSVPETVWCYAHATMPEQAVFNKKATVEVILSRDEIIRASGVGGGGEVNPQKGLIVQIQARKHCITSGESRLEVPVPEPGEETELYFDVIPKYAGTGEVRVIVRQGNHAIANLKLFPRFITAPTADMTAMLDATAELAPLANREELENVLYIREGELGEKRVLDFEFESQTLGIKVRQRSQPFANADSRERYILQLYEEIEEFWADNANEYERFMRRLRSRGAEMFDKLIPKELQRVLWEARDSLEAIQVFSDEPFIPWELVYLKQPGKPISSHSCFLAEKGMVRGYSEPEEITRIAPERLRVRQGKVKYVIPKYPAGSGNELPGAQIERRMLEMMLRAEPIAANSSDVLDALSDPGSFDILHFACHGVADADSIWDAALLMQGKLDARGYERDDLVSSEVEYNASLLESEDSPGPLVFLNACQVGRKGYCLTGTGGFARAFLRTGAGAFISTHWSVGDLSALEFSKTLYLQLLNGQNMLTAVKAAREAAKNKQEPTWLSYVVYADPYAVLVKVGA